MKTCIRWRSFLARSCGVPLQPGAKLRMFLSSTTMMNRPPFDDSHSDRRGILIASLCFVHCVAGPVLLSFAGMASLVNVSEKFEPLFLLGSATMGAIALVPAYRKKHGRLSCLALFTSGLVCLLLRRYIEWTAIPVEAVGSTLGVSLLVAAHALNLRFSRRCGCCDPTSETASVVSAK